MNVSQFKDIDDIDVLSVEFFNKLLAYRNNYQYRSDLQEGAQQSQSYAEWYARNFGRSH